MWKGTTLMTTTRNTKRKDKARVVLRKGESQRKDGKYDFRWTSPDGKRHSIYAPTLEELREKEKGLQLDSLEGIKAEARYVTLNDVFTLWAKVKRGLKDNTFQNYLYLYRQFVEPDFGKSKVSALKKSDVKHFIICWQVSAVCRFLQLTVYTRFCIKCWTWQWMIVICGATLRTMFYGS